MYISKSTFGSGRLKLLGQLEISLARDVGRDQRDFRQRDCTDNRGALHFVVF